MSTFEWYTVCIIDQVHSLSFFEFLGGPENMAVNGKTEESANRFCRVMFCSGAHCCINLTLLNFFRQKRSLWQQRMVSYHRRGHFWFPTGLPSFGGLALVGWQREYTKDNSKPFPRLHIHPSPLRFTLFFLSCVLGENRKIFHEQECEKTLITLLSAEVSKHCFVS